jgi:hypothetical protein
MAELLQVLEIALDSVVTEDDLTDSLCYPLFCVQLFDMLDTDKGGTLSASEVRAPCWEAPTVQLAPRSPASHPWQHCFTVHPMLFALRQVRALMRMLGMRVSAAEARVLVAGVDADGSGALDFDEFLQVRCPLPAAGRGDAMVLAAGGAHRRLCLQARAGHSSAMVMRGTAQDCRTISACA